MIQQASLVTSDTFCGQLVLYKKGRKLYTSFKCFRDENENERREQINKVTT
jgi:hypothetical protein